MARKPKKNFAEKIQEEMPEFAAAVDGASVDALEKRLSDIAKAAEANEQKKEDDEELEQAQANASELAAPYRDARKELRKQTKYIIKAIKDKGGKVD